MIRTKLVMFGRSDLQDKIRLKELRDVLNLDRLYSYWFREVSSPGSYCMIDLFRCPC